MSGNPAVGPGADEGCTDWWFPRGERFLETRTPPSLPLADTVNLNQWLVTGQSGN